MCNGQKCKKMSLSYAYVEICYSAIEIFHTYMYITQAVRQTAKDTKFNYFLRYSTVNCEENGILDFIKRPKESGENIIQI